MNNIEFPTTGNPLLDWAIFVAIGLVLAAILAWFCKRDQDCGKP